jgi:hypothetical protein
MKAYEVDLVEVSQAYHSPISVEAGSWERKTNYRMVWIAISIHWSFPKL